MAKERKPFRLTKTAKQSIVAGIAGVGLIIFNFLYLSHEPHVSAILNIVAVFIIVGTPLVTHYVKYKKLKAIEMFFPKYIRDIADNVASGMTLSQAVKSVTINDYGALTPYVKEIYVKMSWGIPFEKILSEFARKIDSPRMTRNVQTIVESYRSGGSMSETMMSVAQSLEEIEHIKKERSASVYSQIVNGYIIYVVFLGVMIGLSRMMTPSADVDFSVYGGVTDIGPMFNEIFRNLIVIQGLFAGLAIGKISEGTIIAGIKHAVILVIGGYSFFMLFG